MSKSPFEQLRDNELPGMVRWYDPRLLTRIGVRTIVSSVFGQYADQRLIQAATDQTSEEALLNRYDFSDPTAVEWKKRVFVEPESQSFWLDYIADVGDGFDSTYTLAYLLAQDKLKPEGSAEELRHGDILIMGGDQCYPQATREDYRLKLQTPYEWALDLPTAQRKMFAIPGNHDWYDGLTSFDSLFCASRDRLSDGLGTRIGGWQCLQHRSYWALKLPHNWWIWGTDIQFSKYLDVSQVNYFRSVAARMSENDKLIICMAQPNWLMAEFTGADEEANFFKITSIARERGVRICAVIAGDWHHYAHYFAHDLGVHFFTSGGGGAFLHPTHILKDSLTVRWPERKTWDQEAGEITVPGDTAKWESQKVDIRLKKQRPTVSGRVSDAVRDVLAPIGGRVRSGSVPPIRPLAPKIYPGKGASWLLSLRNVFFPFYNFSFAMGIGAIYWIVTWQFDAVARQYGISDGKVDDVRFGDGSILAVLVKMPLYLVNATLSIGFSVLMLSLFIAVVAYVEAVDTPAWRRWLTKFGVGIPHFLAHLVVMFSLFLVFNATNNALAPALQKKLVQEVELKDTNRGWLPKVVVEETIEEPLSPRSYERRRQNDPGSRHLRQAPAPQGPFSGPSPMQRGPQFQGPQIQGPPSVQPLPPQPPGSSGPSGLQADQRPLIHPDAVRELVGLLYPFQMILIGGFAGGFLWGMYWVLSGLLGRMHCEDAFAALRITGYKNFLRMKFEPNRVTIYPIGIDKIPPRHIWRNRRTNDDNISNSQLVAGAPIVHHLIEAPVVIDVADVKVAGS